MLNQIHHQEDDPEGYQAEDQRKAELPNLVSIQYPHLI